MGTREYFRDMCSNLAEIVQSDISEQHVGKWHDESYLNMYLSKSKDVEILRPEFCFVEGYGQLVGISPLIMALEKGSNRTR